MKYCLSLLFTALIYGDDAVEVTSCQNGTFGQISIAEVPNLLFQGTAGFLRQNQCDSTIAITRVAAGTCNVTFAGSSPATEPVVTPSKATPVLSYLDAGPQIALTGPVAELKLGRAINGGATTYSFASATRPLQFLVPGRYEIKTEEGRDLPAMNLSVDYWPVTITAPPHNAPLSSASLPSVSWTGGSEAMRKDIEVQVRAASRDGRRAYDLRCRLGEAASGAGEFTVPRETWELVPADVRSAGFASIVLVHSGLVTTIASERLEGGIQVYFAQFPGVGLQLVQ